MADSRAKAVLYDALTEAAKALANGRRAELVDVLVQSERFVEEVGLAVQLDKKSTRVPQTRLSWTEGRTRGRYMG